MAHSPGSAERRAHLIREMSRQGDRSKSPASNGSSNGSIVHEQFQSFARVDTESQQLPPLRVENDFQINTSALKRAFPDFSQNGSSEEEDSIEIGRGGVKRGSKNTPTRGPPSEDITEDMEFAFGNDGRFRLVGTPPIRPRTAVKNNNIVPAVDAKRDRKAKTTASGKENEHGGKETRYGSSSSKENEARDRKASDMHATVDSDHSGSVLNERPGALNTSVRNTRFGNRRAKESTSNQQQTQNATNVSIGSGVGGTHQSFVLPDMPNITELISGVRQDGTPIFTRSAKSKSRFSTPNNRRPKQGHLPVGNVPIPTDEKALYASLQLLQDKVAALEQDKIQSEKKIDDYELEVLQLKSKLEEMENLRHSDSGIGTDPDDAKAKEMHDDKSKVESSIKMLQERLERTNRKVSKSEATIQNLTKDRDAAHQQLAVAFLNSEDLKLESQAMRDELENIRSQLKRLNREHEKRISQLVDQEIELRGKIERREKAINEMSSLAKELWQTRQALAEAVPVPIHPQPPSNLTPSLPSEVPEQLQLRKNRRMSHEPESKSSKPSTAKRYSDSFSRFASKSTEATGETSRRHPMVSIQRPTYDYADDAASNAESTTNITMPRPSTPHELTRNSTYMSFMEGDEVSKLRRVVQEDKAKLALSRGERPVLPRKSSLKKVQRDNGTKWNVRDDDTVEDMTRATRDITIDRQFTQQSATSHLSGRRRRGGAAEQSEVTSAFILPDITFSGAALNAQVRASLDYDRVKQTVSIPRPVPVSERMPAQVEGEPDVTLRPARNPGLALATVLRGLENEVAELRTQLAQQESLYHQHDPSLSKQKRKIVYARMQKLLTTIEIRADQIYALYDVLEGQKVKGQTMKEDEVEVTLQNIGIDPSMLHKPAQNNKKTVNYQQVNDDNDDSSVSEQSEELPWEGFEPTQTQTLDNFPRLSGKKFAA